MEGQEGKGLVLCPSTGLLVTPSPRGLSVMPLSMLPVSGRCFSAQ